jgi:D-lyxose ketol-isomerase
MRRSEINRLIREAEALLQEFRFALPPWAGWSPEEWRARPDVAAFCRAHQMGWDVTDFGFGRFEERGLLLFCLRNGIQGRADERPYAEKLLVVREGQETPFHLHRVKMEDIIVRGGGTLVAEVQETDEAARPRPGPAEVECDGERRIVEPGEPIRLGPSDNVFLDPVGRFAAIEEDEPPYRLLWNELPGP